MSTFVPRVTIDVEQKGTRSVKLLDGLIAGATPYHHTVEAGGSVDFLPENCYHIMQLISGAAVFETGGKAYRFEKRTAFIPDPAEKMTVRAETDVQLLEIRWEISEGDAEELRSYRTVFPVSQVYQDSMQYVDLNKSEKTISRSVITQRTIPRFCMGSVESYGYDKVRPHDHPMLDQYFFSFPENNMNVLIDGEPIPMGGNELLYIPLGSNHGVEVFEGDHMHYMWIDFYVDDTSLERLDSRHIPTGTMRSFDDENAR